jgi:putative phage-type endonuclease
VSYQILDELEPKMNRRNGIGGTDIGAIVGLKPFGRTAYDVYLEKTGRVEPQPDNPQMRRGRLLEQVVMQMTAEEAHLIVDEVGEIRHKDREWMVSHPDGRDMGNEIIVEAKTAGTYRAHEWGESGTDDAPPAYLTQVAWYMATLDWDKAIIGVLIGGEDFRIYNIGRDRTLEDYLLEKAERFWFKNVKADTPPPLEASSTVDRYIKQRFPRDTAEVRTASPEEALMLSGYAAVRQDFDHVEALKEKYEAEIKLAIGEAAGLEFEGGRVTWRRSKDGVKVDWEAIAMTLKADKELIARYSEPRPGSRRFLPKFQ